MALLSGVVDGEEVGTPMLVPSHRPPDLPRRPRNQEVLRIDLPSDPEHPADIHPVAENPLRVDRKEPGNGSAGEMDELCDSPEVEFVSFPVGDQAPGLNGSSGSSCRTQFQVHDFASGLEGAVDISLCGLEIDKDVLMRIRLQPNSRRSEHCARRNVDHDVVGRVPGDLMAIGHHDGDRLTDVPNPVLSEHRLKPTLESQCGSHPDRDQWNLPSRSEAVRTAWTPDRARAWRLSIPVICPLGSGLLTISR